MWRWVVDRTDVGDFFGGEETHFVRWLPRGGLIEVVTWWDVLQGGAVALEGVCWRVRGNIGFLVIFGEVEEDMAG